MRRGVPRHPSSRPSRRGGAAPKIVVLACLAVALSGCGDERGRSTSAGLSTPDLGSVPRVDATVRLPFQDYELTGSERARLQEGEARLLTACMQERGFRVRIGGDYLRPVEEVAYADATMWGGPFGTMPLAHARRYGYKPEPDGAFVKGPGFYGSNPGYVYLDWGPGGPTPGADLAFHAPAGGDAEAGCLAEVEAEIGPLVDKVDLEAELGKLAREHPDVEAATAAWVRCMGERGYAYAAVWEASQEFSLAAADRRQIQVAAADVECTLESRWADYYYAALSDYERQVLERDPDFLESVLASEEERLAAVERELGA